MSVSKQEGEPDVLTRAVIRQPGFKTQLVGVQQELLLNHARNAHGYHRNSIGIGTQSLIKDRPDLETATEGLIRRDELPRRMVGEVNMIAAVVAILDYTGRAVRNG